MDPSACSGPRLAPPIKETADTATIPGTTCEVHVGLLEVVDQARDIGREVGQPA